MMLTPEAWPQFPVLPLKIRGTFTIGCLASLGDGPLMDDGKIILFKCPAFGFDPNAPKELFDSVDQILAAGWVVD